MKKLLVISFLFVCSAGALASSLYDSSLTQTRQEAYDSYRIQKEIARQNNDTHKLWQLQNNYNMQTRDTHKKYYNR